MNNEEIDNTNPSPLIPGLTDSFSWSLLGILGTGLVNAAKDPLLLQQLSEAQAADAKESQRIEEEENLEAEYEAHKNTAWAKFNQGNNEIKLLIFAHNNTDETLQLIETDFEVEATSKLDIPPNDIIIVSAKKYFDSKRLSAVTGRSQTFIKHFFTYGAGDMKCRFETSMVVKSSFGIISTTLTPTWNHQVRSIGRKNLVCTSRLRTNVPEEPYSYCLDVHIGEEY